MNNLSNKQLQTLPQTRTPRICQQKFVMVGGTVHSFLSALGAREKKDFRFSAFH